MLDLIVIIPTYNRKQLVDRALQSILNQEAPFSFSVLVSDDGSTDGTLPYLRERYSDAIGSGRLLLHDAIRTGDPAGTRNQGVRAAPPSQWLAFLDSDDWWAPGRLSRLASLLADSDLILETRDPLPQSSDPLRWLIERNPALASGTLMRREIFDRVGPFREGYYAGIRGKPLAWGWEDYEMWLRSAAHLERNGRLHRFHLRKGGDVMIETQPGGAGRVEIREQMRRELGTLLRTAPLFPLRVQPLFARRILGAAKAAIFG